MIADSARPAPEGEPGFGHSKPLVIAGPTGAGKSDVALAIARAWGAVVVSMDAMQVYRGFDIGTAKLPAHDRDPARGGVEHRCIDIREHDEAYSAADFAQAVDDALQHHRVVICGGTTFYLRAWEQGLIAAPPADAALRARFEGLENPHEQLQLIDPVLAARLHPNDRMRVVRGLEYHAQTGQRLSDAHAADPKLRRPCTVVWVDRGDLYERLDARVIGMMDDGYLEEVRGLLERGVPRTARPMKSLGYEHLAAHLEGELPLDEAIRLTQRDTRHFARKQRGFLRTRGDAVCDDPIAHARLTWGPPPHA